MPGRRTTLTFRHQQAQTYRVDLRTADGRNYVGAFTLPYDAPTWAANTYLAQVAEAMQETDESSKS